MKKFLYVDESGDLGFDFNRKNPSDFFTITLLLVNGVSENKKLRKEVEIVLKRKLNTKNKKKRIVLELKGTKTNLSIKKYFYERVRKIDFSIYSITINKKNVKKELQINKPRLYNYILGLLLDKVNFRENLSSVILFLDKSKNRKEIKDCNKYLEGKIESKISLETEFRIYHENSIDIRQLQVVDLFCNGISKKYNKKNTEWFSVFKEKITYENIYFS